MYRLTSSLKVQHMSHIVSVRKLSYYVHLLCGPISDCYGSLAKAALESDDFNIEMVHNS